MKGDHLFEGVKLQSSSSTMFSKLHSHSPSSHPQQQQLQLHSQHHQQLTRERHNISEEEESRSSGGGTGDFGGQTSGGGGGVGSIVIKKVKTSEGHSGGSVGGVGGSGGGGGDGASIEVSRRPRGRPPGSKNKPKPPIIITRDTECAMRPHILEISSGLDIIDSIARFARQRNVGLCVLTASGTVSNVSLRQPTTTPGSTVTFHGRFDILSISATYLPPSSSSTATSLPPNGCSISLSGPQGQIFGGSVVGALIAATNVFIVATSFTSPTYHRLPIEEEVPHTSDSQVATTPPPSASDAGVENLNLSTQSDSGENAMTIYNCTHLPHDVIWTPTARPPPSQHY